MDSEMLNCEKVEDTEQDTTISTVYLFFEHETGDPDLYYPDGYSLFGMDITVPTKPGQDEQGWYVKQPELHARIVFHNPRIGMVCAKLGSKFYFLGGYIGDDGSEIPSDVWVYDPTHLDNLKKDPVYRVAVGKPMNSGKVDPFVFETNGKLYVLSRRVVSHSIIEELFEEYDPVKDCWTKLENPPVEFEWCGSYVYDSGRVVTLGTFVDSIFTFDPSTCRWSKHAQLIFSLHPKSLFVEDRFYGLRCITVQEITKLGLSADLSKIYSDNPGVLIDFEWRPPDVMICHLGHRFLCCIGTGSGLIPASKHSLDPHLRTLDVVIYKDLDKEPFFELKRLHRASFAVHTQFNSIGALQSCHVLGTVERNMRVHLDDKRIETNPGVKGEEKKKKKKKNKKKKKKAAAIQAE